MEKANKELNTIYEDAGKIDKALGKILKVIQKITKDGPTMADNTMGSFSSAMIKVSEGLGKLHGKMTGLMESAGPEVNKFAEDLDKIKGAKQDWTDKIVLAGQDIQNANETLFTQLGGQITNYQSQYNGMFKSVTGVFGQITEGLGKVQKADLGPLDGLAKRLGKFWGTAGEDLNRANEKITGHVEKIQGVLTDAQGYVKDKVARAVEKLSGHIASFTKFAGRMAEGVRQVVAIYKTVTDIVAKVRNIFAALPAVIAKGKELWGKFVEKWQGFKEKAAKVYESFKKGAAKAFEGVKHAASKTFDAMAKGGRWAFEAVKSGASKVWEFMKNPLPALSKAWAGLKGVASSAFGGGKQSCIRCF